jgi:DNA invertase Pin-like site-specific DNA recombinase
MTNAIGYCRVSTDKQEVQAQENAINELCAREGMKVSFVTETVSSRKQERKIHEVIENLKEGETLVVYEASRLARSTTELFSYIQSIKQKGANIFIIKPELRISAKGSNINSEAILFALGIASQIERDMISERTRNALQAKKKEGVILGRPKGRGKKIEQMENAQELVKMYQIGLSFTKLAKYAGTDKRTVSEFLKAQGHIKD